MAPLLAFVAAAVQPVPSGDEIIRIVGRDLRVSDVVGRGLHDGDPGIGRRVVARLPVRAVARYPRRALAALIRRVVPGIELPLAGEGAVTVIGTRDPLARRGATPCVATTRAVDEGGEIGADLLTSVPCDGSVRGRLRYDRSAGVVRADEALPAGTRLGRLAMPGPAAIRTGAGLTLVSSAGPVTVRRAVTAMQPGRPGGRLFVRDAAGRVFAAPVGGAGR